MRRSLFLVIIICAAIVLPTSVPAAAQTTCQPFGWFVGGGGGYDHIANGLPKSANCWSSNVALVTTTDCFSSSTKAFQFSDYGGRVSQTIIVPADLNDTYWDLTYLLTMNDPHNNSWWTRLKATVYDVTASRILAEKTYWGDDPDVTCSRRDMEFTGNLAGHTLQVTFSGMSAEDDAIVRVRGIGLIQTSN